MTGLGHQAKVLTARQVETALRSCAGNDRDRAMILMSLKAGMRAKEIACLTWSMVTDSEGRLADTIALANSASKGRHGGRAIPMHPDLKIALAALYEARKGDLAGKVIRDSRGVGITANNVAQWFKRLYAKLDFVGCSSHSGRRTFGTRLAIDCIAQGGTLRDVQELMGHASMQSTSRYIDQNPGAQKRMVVGL